ncbi:MAG: hypothetical protein GY861_25085 [bacterium]|nr:hypothetical protein [bacterium]
MMNILKFVIRWGFRIIAILTVVAVIGVLIYSGHELINDSGIMPFILAGCIMALFVVIGDIIVKLYDWASK